VAVVYPCSAHANMFVWQICIYYLVLRGLDTIEDDMTIPDEVKQHKVLRSFHEKTVTPGWNFTESGPKKKTDIF
jgi:farnesyl-diphosphate farnesyltransferase